MELSIAVSGEDTEHQRGLKKFERATMTRIGRYQVGFPTLLAMHPTGETTSPRSRFSRTKLRPYPNAA
jgi:hypothetical protein